MKIINGIKTLYGDGVSLFQREVDFYKVRPKASILFLTYRCNSKCKTCTMWKKPQDAEIAKEIGLDEWKRVVNQLQMAGVKNVEVFGGNVLLRKDVLIPLLAYLRQKGLVIHLPTNQIGLDDDIAEAIVRHVSSVYISTDGVDQDQDAIRGIGGASNVGGESITKLLSLRSKLCGSKPGVRLVCNCTVSKFNYRSITKIAKYAEEKGFDEIHFEYAGEFDSVDIKKSKVNGIEPEPFYVKQEESILLNKQQSFEMKNILKDLRHQFKESPLRISTVNIDSLAEKDFWQGTIPHKKCYAERNEVTVDPYGNVVICPFINNYVVGNLLEKPFAEIWNNDRHQIFRASQNRGDLPMCRHCILGVQRNPGIMKSLERIYLTRIRPVIT